MPVLESDVLWAEVLENDPTTGRPNREAIPFELRDSGLQRNQGLPRPFINQILYQQGSAILTVQDDFIAADSGLQSNIDDEAATRAAADIVLQDNIDDEASTRESTDTSLQDQIDTLTSGLAALIDKVIPKVGDTWITKSTETPVSRFGLGTWSLIEGRVLVGYDSGDPAFDTIGEEGGSGNHTHTFSDTFITSDNGAEALTIPRDGWGTDGVVADGSTAHTSGRMIAGSGNVELAETIESVNGAGNNQTVNTTDHSHSGSISGTTSTISNLQPYHVVYIWERTA